MILHQPVREEVQIDRVVLTRFMPGEDLLQALEKVVRDHRMERGLILSALGGIKEVVFVNVKPHTGLPLKTEEMHQVEEAGPFELLSLEGNVFPSQDREEAMIHLHAILGTASGAVIGGHLLKARVFTTVEIVLGNIAGSSVFKAKSEVTGRMELLKR